MNVLMQEIDINYHQNHSCTEIPKKIIRKFRFQSFVLRWKVPVLPLPSVKSENGRGNTPGQPSHPVCERPLLPETAISEQACAQGAAELGYKVHGEASKLWKTSWLG